MAGLIENPTAADYEWYINFLQTQLDAKEDTVVLAHEARSFIEKSKYQLTDENARLKDEICKLGGGDNLKVPENNETPKLAKKRKMIDDKKPVSNNKVTKDKDGHLLQALLQHNAQKKRPATPNDAAEAHIRKLEEQLRTAKTAKEEVEGIAKKLSRDLKITKIAKEKAEGQFKALSKNLENATTDLSQQQLARIKLEHQHKAQITNLKQQHQIQLQASQKDLLKVQSELMTGIKQNKDLGAALGQKTSVESRCPGIKAERDRLRAERDRLRAERDTLKGELKTARKQTASTPSSTNSFQHTSTPLGDMIMSSASTTRSTSTPTHSYAASRQNPNSSVVANHSNANGSNAQPARIRRRTITLSGFEQIEHGFDQVRQGFATVGHLSDAQVKIVNEALRMQETLVLPGEGRHIVAAHLRINPSYKDSIQDEPDGGSIGSIGSQVRRGNV